MTGSSGSASSSGNCLLYGSLVTLADGRRVPIETLSPGDEVRSLLVPGLKTDVPFRAQYEWLSTWGLDGATTRAARVSEVRLGEHDGFCLINRRIKATFEHPFLVRRGDAWGFCSAELLQAGDLLIVEQDGKLAEEEVTSLEQIEGHVRTVAIRVPGTNTYIADGAWTHNDVSASASSSGISPDTHSTSASSSSSASSSKSSGSSFASSSESVGPSMLSSSGGTSGIGPTGGG
jgi:hypothetical protein